MDTTRRTVLAGLSASAALSHVSAASAQATPPAGIITTQTAPWQAAPAINVRAPGPSAQPNVFLTPQTFQQMRGFGACFNELGWDALSVLPSRDRDAIIQELFSPGGGNLSLCRMPVGANDFSRDYYSYDEVDGDFDLRHFSLAHDDTSLVPFIRAAKRVRRDLRLWASPWTPPTWMKTNRHYASVPSFPGAPPNNLTSEQIGREGTDMFIQEERYFDAYARYFGKFIDAYRSRGIAIEMVMPQNEFNSAQPFPSCCWTPEGLARFIPYLGREMERRDVEIFFGTFERPDENQFERVLAAPDAARYIKGIGLQWGGKNALPFIHHAHPDLPIYQTEQECGDGRNDWRFARYAWSLFKTYLQNGACAYDYWNIALKAGGLSRWGWAQNSLVTVDEAARTYRFNHEYYLLKHFSAFVQPGAVRLNAMSYSGFEDVLAFRNPGGEVVIITQNTLSEPQSFGLLHDNRIHDIVLPPDCFASFRLS